MFKGCSELLGNFVLKKYSTSEHYNCNDQLNKVPIIQVYEAAAATFRTTG